MDLPEYGPCNRVALNHVHRGAFAQVNIECLRPQSVAQTVNLAFELQHQLDATFRRGGANVQSLKYTSDGRDEIDKSLEAVQRCSRGCVDTRGRRLIYDIENFRIKVLVLDKWRVAI